MIDRALLTPKRTGNVDEDISAELVRRAELYARAANDATLQAALMERCRRDILFWFDNFAWTFDNRRPPNTIPLLLFEHQLPLPLLWVGQGDPSIYRATNGNLLPLIVEKSRDQGASVICAEASLWDWLFGKAANYGFMTRVGSDLDDQTPDSLFGKLDIALEMLPPWMRPKVKRRSGPKPMLKNLDTGSYIVGSATTSGAWRGPRLKRIWVDEAAHILLLASILTSISAATDAPALTSSVNGRGNRFAKIAHSEGSTTNPYGDPNPAGWCKLRLHYSQDPRKDAAWITWKKNQLSVEDWAQEYEIDYAASRPGRIWPEFRVDTHIYGPREWSQVLPWLTGAQIIESWDFGSGPSLTGVAWWAFLESNNTLYGLDYRVWRETPVDQVADDVGRAGWLCDTNPNGRRPHRRVGDIAGKARWGDQRSWLSCLKARGITIQGRLLSDQEATLKAIRQSIRDERFFLSPACARRYTQGLPTLAESVEQYRREFRGRVEDYVGDTPKPLKDQFSHLADVVQYAAADVWPPVKATTISQGRPR